MTDRPIIFSAPMVRALLDGRKTQTRRIVKCSGVPPEFCGGRYDDKNDPSNWGWEDTENGGWITLDQYAKYTFIPYAPGDRLWVREAWSARMTHGWTIADARSGLYQTELLYRADGEDSMDGWWPSIHMPREFSRLTLTVTDVRVQRLQDITAEECTAEGIPFESDALSPYMWSVSRFADIWNSLHGPSAWDANPWVVALTFTVQRGNIDEVRK